MNASVITAPRSVAALAAVLSLARQLCALQEFVRGRGDTAERTPAARDAPHVRHDDAPPLAARCFASTTPPAPKRQPTHNALANAQRGATRDTCTSRLPAPSPSIPTTDAHVSDQCIVFTGLRQAFSGTHTTSACAPTGTARAREQRAEPPAALAGKRLPSGAIGKEVSIRY